MKSSSAIKLTLITSIAALYLDCNNERAVRYCVDGQSRVVDDKNCSEDRPTSYGFHWSYLSSRNGQISNGTVLRGGSTTVPSTGFVTPSEASSRGFFGGAGEAASGGEGHAGGVGGGE